MTRIVSVWLKAWPIARLVLSRRFAASSEPVDLALPLVLVAPGNGGTRVVALNRRAQESGLVIGDLLSNARSKVHDLQTRDWNAAADAEALQKLALWAVRFTPTVACWDEASGADGLFLDIEGCAHLFGGEAALLAELETRLRLFGLAPRLAIADTAGASWAVARYGNAQRAIVPPGEERQALEQLPIAALRLSDGAQSLMRRLGFKRIGQVMDQPRAPFAARFESEYLRRLDQALGDYPEPLTPVIRPPIYRAHASFVEPIFTEEHVMVATRHLLETLQKDLVSGDAGARLLSLLLFRVDGGVQTLRLGLAAPSRDPDHIVRLIGLRLARLNDELSAEFGYEAAAVHVLVAEPFAAQQVTLAMDGERPPAEALSSLIDRLQQHLGEAAVYQLHPHESYLPERSEKAGPVKLGKDKPVPLAADVEANRPTAPRPLLLLSEPEAAEVTALLPDGPPRRFRWRGMIHTVAEAQGPERITPEWWRRTTDAERDYYVVEDTDGHRYWLYRDGLYGGGDAPRWFVHGTFA